MKKLISVLSLLLLAGCGSDKGATTVAGACTQTVYSNGNRYTCSTTVDVIEYAGQVSAIIDNIHLCGLNLTLERLSDSTLVDLQSGTIMSVSAGNYVNAEGCHYQVGSGPAYNITY